MGSAKTALLLTTAYNFEERGIAYKCFKPVIDTRDKKNVIRSRIGIERECSWIYPDSNLYDMIRDIARNSGTLPEWVLVDEAQFLSAVQVDDLARAVDDFGINVICYGLRTDFRTNLFEGSRRLFEIVNARVNSRGEIITEGEVVEIGGNDKYVAVCRNCWRNKKIEQMRNGQLPFAADGEEI